MIKSKTLKLIVIALIILIDQSSKLIIRSTGGFYICNPGIAFGVEFPQVMLFVLWFLFFIFPMLMGTVQAQENLTGYWQPQFAVNYGQTWA